MELKYTIILLSAQVYDNKFYHGILYLSVNIHFYILEQQYAAIMKMNFAQSNDKNGNRYKTHELFLWNRKFCVNLSYSPYFIHSLGHWLPDSEDT